MHKQADLSFTFSFSQDFKMVYERRLVSEQNASMIRLILVFNFSFLQGYKMIIGSKVVSEQTACMCRLILDFRLILCRLILDFRFIFSQDYDIWEQIYMCKLI